MKAIIFLVGILFGATAFAGAADIYACSNNTLDVAVGVLNGSEYAINVTKLDEGTTQYRASVNSNEKLSTANSIYALSKKMGEHDLLGKGIVLNFNGENSVIAIDGTVQTLKCRASVN